MRVTVQIDGSGSNAVQTAVASLIAAVKPPSVTPRRLRAALGGIRLELRSLFASVAKLRQDANVREPL